jgi:vacuolar-type H+-ATPase subunit H
MPFVKKTIHLSNINLHEKVVKTNLHLTIDHHQTIITAAEKTANNLIAQAKIKAHRLVRDAEEKAKQRESKTQTAMQGLIEKTRNEAENIQATIAEQTKQEVLAQANQLIQALNQSKQRFFDSHEDFFKEILNDMISALTQEIDLKTKLELLAQKVIEKAKGLEEGVIYFNQKDFESQPEVQLPLNWKMLADNDVPQQTCKLSAQGSEWYISFKDIESDVLSFFK